MQTDNLKIGVLGLGAIGSVVSFDLQKSKSNKLSYYSRSNKKSLRIISGKTEFEIPIDLRTSISKPPKLDWLIICLKEYHFSDAMDWFSKLIDPKTKVAIIRNGLRLKEPLLDFTDEQNILECIIDCPTQVLENGAYEQHSNPIFTVRDNFLSNRFKELFKEGRSDIRMVEDFKTESWKKLIESSTLGAILCLTGETCWIFKDEKLRKLYRIILEEEIKVAIADGAKLELGYVEKMLLNLISYPETKGSSMLTDRLKGNPIELGAKNGLITELGKHYKIETPINDLIVALLTHTNKKAAQA